MNSEATDLISIIIPVFNAEKFLKETIGTVLDQTYQTWELLLVNDCSTDKSKEIAQPFLKDKRIQWIDLEKNSGPAIARNKGIDLAKGSYICFLDADDLWEKNKLKKQLSFMKEKNCAFSFTGYEFADENGKPNGKKVHVPEKMNYKDALKNTTIWTSTVMFDISKLSKEDIKMPNIPSEDTATWWKVLKKTDYAFGMPKVLSYYRRTKNTLSSNKIIAIKRIWSLYRKNEGYNIPKSIYYLGNYAFNAIKRRGLSR